MVSLADFYDSIVDGWDSASGIKKFSPVGRLYDVYDSLYNRSHGADRYKLSQIPGFGTWKKFEDKARWYQDYFDINGHDPNYASDYGNGGIPGVSDFARGFTPVRMARQLARMYGAEVELDIRKVELDIQRSKLATQREKSTTYRLSSDSAEAWTNYERVRQKRR